MGHRGAAAGIAGTPGASCTKKGLCIYLAIVGELTGAPVPWIDVRCLADAASPSRGRDRLREVSRTGRSRAIRLSCHQQQQFCAARLLRQARGVPRYQPSWGLLSLLRDPSGCGSVLLAAESVGRYYNATIRGRFDCRINRVPQYDRSGRGERPPA